MQLNDLNKLHKCQTQLPELFCEKSCFQAFCKVHRKNTCVFFFEVAGLQVCHSIKNRLQHRLFPGKFVKVLRAPNLKTIS